MEFKKERIQNNKEYVVKLLLQAFTVTVAAYYVPIIFKTSLKTPEMYEVLFIGLIASITMYILDEIKIN